jgi:acyl-CoA thioesterase I
LLLVATVLIGAGPAAAQSVADTSAANRSVVILAYGDSLTAGFKLPPDAAFPIQLEAALKARGRNVRVVNGGVTGNTAADGLERLDWTLTPDVDAVILELGANDALRGVAPEETKRTLDAMLAGLKKRGLPVLLAGMRAPNNWGPEYDQAFAAIYPALAQKHGAPLYPFFLDGVALERSLNLPDGLHPTRQGVAVIVERITPSVEKLADEVLAARAAAPR